jgi:tRNA(Ile)-lysidine synthase TilS/MesJ
MPAKILMMNYGHGRTTQQIPQLETLITNIEYLLMMPEVTEAQRQRLRPLLMETQAELMETYDIFELPYGA